MCDVGWLVGWWHYDLGLGTEKCTVWKQTIVFITLETQDLVFQFQFLFHIAMTGIYNVGKLHN